MQKPQSVLTNDGSMVRMRGKSCCGSHATRIMFSSISVFRTISMTAERTAVEDLQSLRDLQKSLDQSMNTDRKKLVRNAVWRSA